jgi:hypothetical protein
MRLSDIAVKNNVAPVLYDETFKVSFDLMFLPKRELQKITASNTKMKANPKTHIMEEALDSEAVRKEICQMCVKGWKNLTTNGCPITSTSILQKLTRMKNLYSLRITSLI